MFSEASLGTTASGSKCKRRTTKLLLRLCSTCWLHEYKLRLISLCFCFFRCQNDELRLPTVHTKLAFANRTQTSANCMCTHLCIKWCWFSSAIRRTQFKWTEATHNKWQEKRGMRCVRELQSYTENFCKKKWVLRSESAFHSIIHIIITFAFPINDCAPSRLSQLCTSSLWSSESTRLHFFRWRFLLDVRAHSDY